MFKKELKKVVVYDGQKDFDERLDKIASAQVSAMVEIMKNDMFIFEEDKSKIDVKVKQVLEQSKLMNDLNWQFFVRLFDGKETPVNDFESIVLGQAMKEVKSNPEAPKFLQLIGSMVNLYSSVIVKAGKTMLLRKATTNNRYERVRPESTHKATVLPLINDPKDESGFAKKSGEFGLKYVQVNKNAD